MSTFTTKIWDSLSGEHPRKVLLHYSGSETAFSLGTGHAFEITLPGGKARPLHSLVARAAQHSGGSCELELVPWFYFLQMGRGCRVFQDKTVLEIITEVTEEAGYTDISDSLNGTYPKLEYVVQYNESDFDFLSRLMEEAGIFYYFTFAKNKHTMVLADSAEGCGQGPELSWLGENFPETPDAYIWNVGLVETAEVTTVAVDDYNYLTPTASLLATAGTSYPSVAEFGSGHTLQSAGETLASLRLDSFENTALELTAETSHSGLSAGMIFTLKGHPDTTFNKKWLITSLEMSVDENSGTRCRFAAIPGDKVFRPRCVHPRPRVYGPLTGVVCGKSGEKTWTDEHGRVKVRFHWDHKTKADETASVWLRVSQPWAGKAHGAMFLPRVGDEVLVDFLGGDPDRPIVTGSLYNAAAKTQWPLPDNQTVTGLKDDGKNEMLMDDKKDNERVYFHAQKLLELLVENERRVVIKGEGGDSLKVKGDRKVSVDGDYTITVKGDLTIKAKNIKLEADQALNLKSGTALEIKAGTGLNAQSGAAAEIKGGTNLALSGPTFKLSGSAKGEVNGGGMLDVKGGLVKLN